ncbi:MAG: ThiF family adenylyltransferase, partial [Clostridia bacterium]|nr:ThiF family adenylyltransferase [Clostridia bacterium]
MFSREVLLIGEENLKKLKGKTVALFGVGGVGGFAAEALCRSGIGNISVFDGDKIAESNLNRQIISLKNNVGESKVKVLAERLKAVNPEINVEENEVFFLPENADEYDFTKFDYVIDAVDTVSAKLEIIKRGKAAGVPVISCMGTGGKTDIEKLTVSDINATEIC